MYCIVHIYMRVNSLSGRHTEARRCKYSKFFNAASTSPRTLKLQTLSAHRFIWTWPSSCSYTYYRKSYCVENSSFHTMASLLNKRYIERLRQEVKDQDGVPRMTPTALKLACLDNEGFETPALNDKLYLHFKGTFFDCTVKSPNVFSILDSHSIN